MEAAQGDLPKTVPPADHRDDPSLQFDGHAASIEHGNLISNAPPVPDHNDSLLLLAEGGDGDRQRGENQTIMEENEMRKKLMEMESSFLPEPSTIRVPPLGQNAGADYTYLFGTPSGNRTGLGADPDQSFGGEETSGSLASIKEHSQYPSTRGAEQDSTSISEYHDENTTALEEIEPSPAAEAAKRMGSRDTLMYSENSREAGMDTGKIGEDPVSHSEGLRSAPKSFQSDLLSPSPTQPGTPSDTGDAASVSDAGSRRSRRPKYLSRRQSANRLSYSSATTNASETTSDANPGADYALQSGGAVSGNIQWQRKNLVRSVSLGSVASGISGSGDENLLQKKASAGGVEGLQTLDEEGPPLSNIAPEDVHQKGLSPPTTPKAEPPYEFPTETAIAERIRKIHIPSAFAKQFREDHSSGCGLSPDKRAAITFVPVRSGRSLTLKEQSSTIDRLSKENFDLKMRIHFLSEALNRRSEEGIKEMISENVELKSDKLKLQKDNQSLRRKIRDLEKQLREQQSDKESMTNHDPDGSDDGCSQRHDEIAWLRERVETYEHEIERLRSESTLRESEKRRLAEMVKSLSGSRPVDSDSGAREERDMWKDMLDAETAAREQAEEESRKLRDEVQRLKDGSSGMAIHSRMGYGGSFSTVSERDLSRSTAMLSSGSSVMELELLKQENSELRKEVSAQTSMLTSRNREKERLYQEIEELKLGHQRESGRSVAGDSIFDRSASRLHARPSSSKASDETGSSGSNVGYEKLEMQNGQLRDKVSALKLENQAIRAQLDEYIQELEDLDRAYQADVDQAEEELQNLQQERDQALRMADERDAAFQGLRAEAQEEIDTLGDELDEKIEECQRLSEELRSQEESLKALQAEVRAASEGILRLEEDAQGNLEKYKAVQRELEESSQEMASLERSLFDANNKVQRLTVQIESSQNEIAFLREEQDGDKIRISDLESEAKALQTSLHSEKEKSWGLERRLTEERHQREVVESKEKQEVLRMMNELNRDASAAREEARKLKKSLSNQEIETTTWRDRLMDLENNLRETLGDLTGSRSSLISNIMKLQKELESTALELEGMRSKLEEKESLLRNRDALLESHGLELRKLSELLDRERHGRRADKQSFEQSLKSHQQASRTITQSSSRISELEAAQNQDRKRFASLEQQLRDQLNERNSMLLNLWRHLSALCGPDWAHSNSLINGNLPSQEVIGNILFWPGFSRNLKLAIKTVEGVVSSFKNQMKATERDLVKQYQGLETMFNQRVKRIERMEEIVRSMRAEQQQGGLLSPEMTRLRGDNRLLRAELNLLHSSSGRGSPSGSVMAGIGLSSLRPPSVVASRPLMRHSLGGEGPPGHGADKESTRSTVTGISHISSESTLTDNTGVVTRSQLDLTPSVLAAQEKWLYRLHEAEKIAKAEREGRLLDRSAARQRLAERDAENQRLRKELERERILRRTIGDTGDGDGRQRQRQQQEEEEERRGSRSPSEEGICVDIEV